MNKRYLNYSLLALIPFLIIIVIITFNMNTIQHIDNRVTLSIISWRTPQLSSFFSAVTILANPTSVVATVLILTIIAYVLTKRFHLPLWIILTNSIGSLGLNPLVKNIIQRSRPDEELRLVQEASYSFPSGHAFASMVAFGCVILLLLLFLKPSAFRGVLIVLSFVTILLIGFSRIFLGVHYLSDVVAGFSLGLFWLFISLSIFIPKTPKIRVKE
ncbi:phosphatase PAP2 family protein [Aerococcaceae bacterium DSM 111021]|nr:phosphatase PAP2 family protein [Aerococcaceae bacterium DSM 111021]